MHEEQRGNHVSGAVERRIDARRADAEAPDTVETLLSRRCLDQLGMAQRAGAIAVGATQVDAAIRAKPALLLIEANDGAEEGREKLMSLHIGLWGDRKSVV